MDSNLKKDVIYLGNRKIVVPSKILKLTVQRKCNKIHLFIASYWNLPEYSIVL